MNNTLDFSDLSKQYDEAQITEFSFNLDKWIEKVSENSADEVEHLSEIKSKWEEQSKDDKLSGYLRQRRTIITLQLRELRHQSRIEELEEEVELLRTLNQ